MFGSNFLCTPRPSNSEFIIVVVEPVVGVVVVVKEVIVVSLY